MTGDEPVPETADAFASEVHYCLMNGGVRSRTMRRLWNLARDNSEFQQILESKVSEFRRVTREERVPTIRNLPTRLAEWTADRFQFTPPREIAATLTYVVLTVVLFDTVKPWLPWSIHREQSDSHSTSLTYRTGFRSDLMIPDHDDSFSELFADSNAESDKDRSTNRRRPEASGTLEVTAPVDGSVEQRVDEEIAKLIRERVEIYLTSPEGVALVREKLLSDTTQSGALSSQSQEATPTVAPRTTIPSDDKNSQQRPENNLSSTAERSRSVDSTVSEVTP